MEKLYELKEKLFMELEEISDKPDLGAGDLELAHKLTDTIKNICKICLLEEEEGYSQEGEGGGNSYGSGNSYANRGKHRVRAHYSRDGEGGGYSGRRGRGYSRNNHSQGDGRSEMMEHLEMALDSATDEDREDIKRFIRKMGNA